MPGVHSFAAWGHAVARSRSERAAMTDRDDTLRPPYLTLTRVSADPALFSDLGSREQIRGRGRGKRIALLGIMGTPSIVIAEPDAAIAASIARQFRATGWVVMT